MAEIELGLMGIEGKDSILNIGRSRMRAVYLRPDGNLTNPLPADPYSVMYYFRKGFKAPPKDGETPEVKAQPVMAASKEDIVRCPFCSFEAKGVFSLRTHLNKHVSKSKKGG